MKRSGTRCILQSHGPMSKCNICTFSPAEQNITRLFTVSLKITDKPTAGGLGSDRINKGGGWLITAPSQWSVYLSDCLSGRVWAAQNRQLVPIWPPGGSHVPFKTTLRLPIIILQCHSTRRGNTASLRACTEGWGNTLRLRSENIYTGFSVFLFNRETSPGTEREEATWACSFSDVTRMCSCCRIT